MRLISYNRIGNYKLIRRDRGSYTAEVQNSTIQESNNRKKKKKSFLTLISSFPLS